MHVPGEQGENWDSGLLVTHFLTVADVPRSRAFHADVLGGEVVLAENPCIVKLTNSWLIMNPGGGPTHDKPDVTLRPPDDPGTASSFLDIPVADIERCYRGSFAVLRRSRRG